MGPPEAHEPPKLHGPRGHCTPCPPLGGPDGIERNGMERKLRYGIWRMPEWNGIEDFKNGMEDNLSYFHTNS